MSTLADVTKRLEEVNTQGVRQRDDMISGLELIAETIENSGMTQEQMLENARHQAKMLELLEGIKNGQKPAGGGDGGDGGAGNIGLMGGLLGAALGGLVGAITGYVKAWKAMMKAIMPTKLLQVAEDTMSALRSFFSNIKGRFTAFADTVADIFKSDGPVGKVGTFLSGLGQSLADFFKPITEAVGRMKGTGEGIAKIFEPIANGIRRVFGFFRMIGSSLSGFGVMFKAVASVVGKIFYPLTIILTIWDTVKGAIEGFTEDGIVGGIIGAFTGLVSSLITVPLDMIKGAASWVMGFLGFEDQAAALDSFSFTDIFKNAMDLVIDFIKGIPTMVVNGFNAAVEYAMGAFESLGNLVDEYLIQPMANLFEPIGNFFSEKFRLLMGYLEDIGIPAFEIELPLIDPITIGPWYPFRTGGSDTGTTSIESSTSMSTESISSSDGSFNSVESSQDYIRTVGSHFDDNGVTDDVTNIMVSDSRSVENQNGGSFVANDSFLEFNARTGAAHYNGESVNKDVYMAGKMAAMQGGNVEAIELAMARAAAYEQLSWWNSAKALAGADPIELLAEQEGQSFSVADLVPGSGLRETGEVIENDTIAIADANRQTTAANNTNVVAPTTNNVTNQTVAGPRRSPRNQDPTANVAFSPVG